MRNIWMAIGNKKRKAANLSLDEDLVSEARALDINISRAAENGIALALKAEHERRWRSENADSVDDMNRYIEKNGLPLSNGANSEGMVSGLPHGRNGTVGDRSAGQCAS